jgi:hypothetical protein
MRRQGEGAGGDCLPMRSCGSKGEGVIASHHAWQSPKHVRDNAEVGGCGRRRRVERRFVIAGPGWHDECAVPTDRLKQSGDQAERTALDRADGAEGHVHEEHGARYYAERAKLVDDFRARELALCFGRAHWRHVAAEMPNVSRIGD